MSNTLFGLSGRVAVVTGACGLLGREHCDVLAEAGASVVVADLDGEQATLQATSIQERRAVQAIGLATDVTDPASVQRLVQETTARLGRIDILVNNAGLTVKGGTASKADYFAPFEDYSLELWDRALRTNLTGTFLCSQAVGRVFSRAGRGVMVNVSSIYGLVGPDQRIYRGTANPHEEGGSFNTPASYAATKAGILGLTRYLATYWAGTGIRVNALSPGGVQENHDASFVREYSARTVLGRMARSDDFRGAVLFLCSDASSYMTGANLVVDGGWTAW